MKQTAVEWLLEKIEDTSHDLHHLMKVRGVFEQAKQMEKEQQIALLKFSREMCTLDVPIDYVLNEFNKYYNETFNTK